MVTKVDRPPTLTLAAVNHLRNAILRGEFLPGEALPEVQLSKVLNVSRGTVREALRKLQEEGIVEIITHRGAIVTDLSIQKASEIYTLRAQLEPYAVRLVMEASGYGKQELRKLQRFVKDLSKIERDRKPYDAVEVDMLFHQTLCESCHHELLLDVLRGLQSLTRVFILNTKLYQSDSMRDDVSHLEIVELLKQADPTLAEQTVRRHINLAGQSLVDHMDLHGTQNTRTQREDQ